MMMMLLVFVAIGISAGVASAQLVQPARLDPANPLSAPNLCPNWVGVFDKDRLQRECGFDASNPCAVFTKKDDSEDKPLAACHSTVGIQTIDAQLGTTTYIYGEIAGYLDMNPVDSSLALEYGAYIYACHYPCVNESGPVIRCGRFAEDCPDDFSTARRFVENPSNVVVNHVAFYDNIEMHYKFDDPQSVILDHDPQGVVNAANAGNRGRYMEMREIKQGDKSQCTDGDEPWTFEAAEAYEPEACGMDGHTPCPFFGDALGACFDPDDMLYPCYNATFWMDGLEDPQNVYCTAEEGCPARYISRVIRVSDDSSRPAGQIPIGLWTDVCPYECAIAGGGSTVCAASESHCKAVLADSDPDPVPTPLPADPWDYKIPGSQGAHIVLQTAHSAMCALTTTPAPTSTSAAYRGVVGSLTAFIVASTVVYNG